MRSWQACSDPWQYGGSWSRAAKGTNVVYSEPHVLFVGASKALLDEVELVLGDTYLGLDAAASVLSKADVSPCMRPRLNKLTKMTRHLAISNSMERHFTASGSKKWLAKARELLRAVAGDAGAGCPTAAPAASTASATSTSSASFAAAPGYMAVCLDDPRISQLELQLADLSQRLDAAAADAASSIEGLTSKLPGLIDGRMLEALPDCVSGLVDEDLKSRDDRADGFEQRLKLCWVDAHRDAEKLMQDHLSKFGAMVMEEQRRVVGSLGSKLSDKITTVQDELAGVIKAARVTRALVDNLAVVESPQPSFLPDFSVLPVSPFGFLMGQVDGVGRLD